MRLNPLFISQWQVHYGALDVGETLSSDCLVLREP